MKLTGKPNVLLVANEAAKLPLSEGAGGEFAEFTRDCPDVFRALARVGRDSSIRGIVIDVGVVASGQMEFFSLVGSVRPGLPVYVFCGVETVAQQCDLAIELGATGRLTDVVARALVAACRCEPDSAGADNGAVESPAESCGPPIEAAGLSSQEIADSSASSQQSAVGTNEMDKPPQETEESASDPVRVPWLRYKEVPSRQAPGGSRREPPTRDSPQDESSCDPQDANTARDEHEPLLTDAELAALLDDDVFTDLPSEQGGDDDGGSEAIR